MWQMDSAGLLFVSLTQRFRICQLCVWICVLGCDRGVSRLHRPWWIGHCVSVHVCVCVVSCNACTLVFSSNAKALRVRMLILFLIAKPSNKTHKHAPRALCWTSLCYNALTQSMWMMQFTRIISSPARRPFSCYAHGSSSAVWWLTSTDKWQSPQPPDTRPWLKIREVPSYCGYPDYQAKTGRSP